MNITAKKSETDNADNAPKGLVLAKAFQNYVTQYDKFIELEDVVAGLPAKLEELDISLIARAFQRVGLIGEAIRLDEVTDDLLPVCGFLTNGQFITIIDQDDVSYSVTNSKWFAGTKIISKEKFHKMTTGWYILAAVAFEAVERKYLPAKPNQHWFWSEFKHQKTVIRDIILGTLVANLLAVGVSLFTLQVYDRVIPNQSIPTLWVLVTGVMIAIVFEAILRISRATLLDVSGRQIEMTVSARLFEKLLSMRLSKRPASPGSMLYSMREFGSVREFFTASAVGSVADLPFVVIFIALIYFIAGPVAFIILAAIVGIVVPSLLAQKKMSTLSEEMLGGSAVANKLLIEVTYGHEAVKAARAENGFQKKWEDLLWLISEKTSEQRILSAKLTFWAQSVQQLAYITAIVAGTYLVFQGDLTVGAIIAISILTSRTLSPVTGLSNVLSRWHQVRSSLNSLEAIATSEQDGGTEKRFISVPSLTGDYEISDVVVAYDEEADPALSIQSLKIKRGQTIGILGVNGSGKSSLLKVMSGLYDCTGGTIKVDGYNLSQISPIDVRRHIGYLPQEIQLFSGTLRENLELGRRKHSDKELFDALVFSGLAEFVTNHPRGLDVEILDGGVGVSIGQKQSIGLARLYLADPTIVLMDEPTASFDQMLELRVVENLKQWLKGKTCLLTTHRPAALTLMDEVIVLQAGKIKLKGPTKEVISKLSTPTPKKFDDENVTSIQKTA